MTELPGVDETTGVPCQSFPSEPATIFTTRAIALALDSPSGQLPDGAGRARHRWSRPAAFALPSWARHWQNALNHLTARSSWLAFVWVVLALVGFGVYAHAYHRLGSWLTFFWARAWLGAFAFALASFAIGLELLALAQVHAWSVAERSTVAFSIGVLTFALGIFVAGLFGLLSQPFFFAWPALLVFLGRRALARYARALSRQWTRFGPPLAFPQSLLQALAALLIVAGAFALYLQVITPSNISFDARWYHLPIAESYAAAGRIRPFPEGWYIGAYPQLASWLYTWAFLAPGALEHHLCLAGHLEFTLLLATVAGVSALASRLVSGARLRHGGAALFLFPAIFTFDSNLNLGADHVLAFWAAPLGLLLLRYLTQSDARHAALLGMVLAGAVLTKYQAVYFVVPVGLALAFDFARTRRVKPLLLAAGVTLVLTSPHWLKNWLAYGDPFYPNLYRWLPDHPLYRGAVAHFDRAYWFSGPKVTGSVAQKLHDTLAALFGFSFAPLGWGRGRDQAVVVGSLFTLLLPLLLWVRPRWRALLIAGSVHAALVVWALTYPYDRYLQALMPWMASCVAAILAAAWRTRLAALRFALVLLVALQLIWGGDVYFLRSQAMLGALPLRALGPADQAGQFQRNPYPGQELAAIGAKLPKGARLVGHDFYQSLGVGAEAITDNPDWQGSIDYLQLDPPEQVLRSWRRLGGSHILWPFKKEPRPPEDLARDTVFGRASVAFTDSSFSVAGYRVAELVDRAPAPVMQRRTLIAWLGCGDARTLGVYTPAGLASGTLERTLTHEELERDPFATLAATNALWFRADCVDAQVAQAAVTKEFSKVMLTGEDELWVRFPPDAPPPRARKRRHRP